MGGWEASGLQAQPRAARICKHTPIHTYTHTYTHTHKSIQQQKSSLAEARPEGSVWSRQARSIQVDFINTEVEEVELELTG